ncbi:hypothetical protein [Armatimonas sp.]|uniref:hypothetical protein n=1 Tax=Armatimonas sp. TaxID=1872638 RepID=UPI00286A0914|nr:hypothetical protein [Armatimonas sp.]
MRNQIAAYVLVGVALSHCLLAHAQLPPPFQQTLAIGGTELITIRGRSQEDVRVRADIIYARLAWILADSTLARRDIWIKMTTSEPAIYVKDKLLVTVMPQDSAYNETTPDKQAQIWRIRFAETLPILKSADPPTKT